jgi:hypothetical protein
MAGRQLELSDSEAEDLKKALSVRLLEMRGELARTDDRDYREGLRAMLERLEAVFQRLERIMTETTRTA